MGGYTGIVQETVAQLYFRTLVAYCFLGGIGLMLVYAFLPDLDPGSTNLFWAILLCSFAVIMLRRSFSALVDSEKLVRRVVIFGSGDYAARMLAEYDRNMRALGVRILGCVSDSASPAVSADRLITAPADFYQYCRQNRISEIVVLQQERRKAEGGWLPVPELMECKLRGIAVTNGRSEERRVGKECRSRWSAYD